MVKLLAEPTARLERIADVDVAADSTLLVTDNFTGYRLAPVVSPEHAAMVPTKITQRPASYLAENELS